MTVSPRTYLFVPGNRPERYAKALASGADAVVIDLEDAVAATDKGEARDAVAAWVATAPAADRERVVVRVNGSATAEFGDDLQMMRAAGLDRVMLPKAENAQQLADLAAALPGVTVLALIESALGLDRVDCIAASASVCRLVFGTLDYALDLGLYLDLDPNLDPDPEGSRGSGAEIAASAPALAYAASRIAVASRVAGLAAPVAGITLQLDDEPRLLADWAAARGQGFGAKLCIHPRQIAPLHRAIQPSFAALERARRILAAEAASPGAARLDGQLVDRPIVLQAQRLLRRAEA